MQDFHAARPWLVVDNSSSDRSISRSRASRSKGKCHLPGMPPRRSHIKTAFSVKSGKVPESAERPPNLSIIEATSVMGRDTGTGSSESQELLVPYLGNFGFFSIANGRPWRNNLLMNDLMPNKQDWKKLVATRVLGLIKDMGFNVANFAKAHWKEIGFPSEKAASQALPNREQIDPYYAIRFALVFEIDPTYVLCLHDERHFTPHGKYGLLRENTELKRQAALRSQERSA